MSHDVSASSHGRIVIASQPQLFCFSFEATKEEQKWTSGCRAQGEGRDTRQTPQIWDTRAEAEVQTRRAQSLTLQREAWEHKELTHRISNKVEKQSLQNPAIPNCQVPVWPDVILSCLHISSGGKGTSFLVRCLVISPLCATDRRIHAARQFRLSEDRSCQGAK